MTDTIVIERLPRGLYRVSYNGVHSDPLPWFRITAQLVVAIMRNYHGESGVGR